MMRLFFKWVSKNRIHIIIWCIYIVWETGLVGLSFGVFGHPLTYTLHYLLLIGFFYFNASVGLPWSFEKPLYIFWKLPLILVLEICVFTYASFIIDTFLSYIGALEANGKIELSKSYLTRTFYRFTQFWGFSIGYYYLMTYINERKKTGELERQRLNEIIQKQEAQQELIRAQNAYLIAQINPHFFFNTLDYFYHNVRKSSPEVAEGISALADMMRFATNADKIGGSIRLGDELEQVETLIYLHNVRQKHFIDLDYDEDLVDIFIIPLVVLTLTENIFKHGLLVKANCPASIRIFSDGRRLIIETINVINNIINPAKSNTGLQNIRARLKAAYPNQFTFNYSNLDDINFQTRIEIDLNALNNAGTFSYPLTKTDKELPRVSFDHLEKGD